jgi:hypothetical protein
MDWHAGLGMAILCREPEIPVAFNAGMADIKEFPWEGWRLLEARAARIIEKLKIR